MKRTEAGSHRDRPRHRGRPRLGEAPAPADLRGVSRGDRRAAAARGPAAAVHARPRRRARDLAHPRPAARSSSSSPRAISRAGSAPGRSWPDRSLTDPRRRPGRPRAAGRRARPGRGPSPRARGPARRSPSRGSGGGARSASASRRSTASPCRSGRAWSPATAATPGASQMLYGDPMGYRPFREAVAAYLRTARAVRCEAGADPGGQRLAAGARRSRPACCWSPATPVWVEEPGYTGRATS